MLRGAIAGDDVSAIKNASQALSEVMQEIGTAAYQQAQGGADGQAGHAGAQPNADDNVVDGEFTEA